MGRFGLQVGLSLFGFGIAWSAQLPSDASGLTTFLMCLSVFTGAAIISQTVGRLDD